MQVGSKRAAVWVAALALLVFTAMPAVAAESLSLSDALKQAEANNPGLLIAKQNLKSARASLDQALLQFSVTGSYGYGYVEPLDSWEDSQEVRLSYGGFISARYQRNYKDETWSFDLNPFSLSEYITIRRALIGYQDSEVKYRSQLEDLKYNVANAYYTVLQNDALLALAERSLEVANRAFDDGKAKEQAGLMARADLLRLQTSVYQQRANVVVCRANAQLARTSLANLLGTRPDQIGALTEPAALQTVQYQQDAVMKAALTNRGEIAVADAQVGLARLGLTAARLTPLQGFSVQWTPNQSYGASLTIPLGGTLGNNLSAEASLESAKLSAQMTRDNISAQAMQVYLTYATAVERVEVMRLAMESAREVARVMGLRYDAGLGTVAEKLDAEVTAQTAEQNYVQAQYTVLLAEAGIQRVTWGM